MPKPQRSVFRGVLAVGVLLLLVGAWPRSGPALEGELLASALGPAPRTEKGRFTNGVGEISHGGFGVRFPFFMRRIAGAFGSRPGAPERVENDGAFLRENALHSTPTVTWVGHATLLVQMDHVTFLTDPIWSKTASPVSFVGPKRFVPPGLAIEDLPHIDFVVVSHNHYDHLHLGSLETLAERSPETRFFVPLGNAGLLRKNGIENVTELDWGESREVEGVEVFCLPTQHWSKRSIADDNAALWSSWAVVGPERRFYFAGDTGYFDGFARIAEAFGSFDLAAVPIGAYEPVAMMRASHLDPEEAVTAALDLRAERAIAIHFGTFDLSDEPLDEPPRRFLEAARAQGLEQAWVLEVGETRAF
ncbi:MAG: MBL fold metallo-hydrolase [Myxococcota bacterium]|nr:MBL fold metallo-hydrolase [Myxococcota bacterium]